VWGDDVLLLPEGAPQRWLQVFTGETLELFPAVKEAPLSSIFRTFPVALLVGLSQE